MRQPIEALGEQRPGETAALVGVLDPHRLEQADLGHRIEPEERVAGDLAVGVTTARSSAGS